MKKITTLFLGIAALTFSANAQTTIFKETFGTPTTMKGEDIVNHVWDNSVSTGITYSWNFAAPVSPDTVGTLNIRSNNPSDSIAVGGLSTASGFGNLYFNKSVINSFTISGINTSSFNNISLSFMIYGKNKSDVTLLKLQYDSGSGLTDVGTTQISALSTKKAIWSTVSGITLPASSNLSLTFSTPTLNVSNASAPIEIRIDDILITGTATATSVKTINPDNRKVTAFNSTLKLDGFTSGIVEIFNTQGKRVYMSAFKETIEPQLAKGLYIVRVGDFRQKISL
jgi:hypothetical protein